MALVTTKEMLQYAYSEGYAIGAFNTENMEMTQAIVAAAEVKKAPVIIQTTPGTLKYASLATFLANVRTLAEHTSVPVAMHLDHGNSYDLASRAYRAGYTSVMIDGSHESFEMNVALTRQVVQMCQAGGVPVEGELGRVGGKEDDLESDHCGYTDVKEAVHFVAATGVSALAVGVGTAHGIYTETPVLNLERITELKAAVPVPLVLHGASGLADEVVEECVKRGMSKVNYATELRIAFTNGVMGYMKEHPETIDPKKYGAAGRSAVQAFVERKMEVCRCVGKAI